MRKHPRNFNVTIEIDTKEHRLLEIFRLAYPEEDQTVFREKTLNVGDICFVVNGKRCTLIERKTVQDFYASQASSHFREQRSGLILLKREIPSLNVMYLVEGSFDQARIAAGSRCTSAFLLELAHQLSTKYMLPVVMTSSLQGTIDFLEKTFAVYEEYGSPIENVLRVKETDRKKMGRKTPGGAKNSSSKRQKLDEEECFLQAEDTDMGLARSAGIGSSVFHYMRGVPGMSDVRAQLIAESYHSIPVLVSAYKRLKSEKERNTLFADFIVPGQKKRFGKKLSAKIYRWVFNLPTEVDQLEEREKRRRIAVPVLEAQAEKNERQAKQKAQEEFVFEPQEPHYNFIPEAANPFTPLVVPPTVPKRQPPKRPPAKIDLTAPSKDKPSESEFYVPSTPEDESFASLKPPVTQASQRKKRQDITSLILGPPATRAQIFGTSPSEKDFRPESRFTKPPLPPNQTPVPVMQMPLKQAKPDMFGETRGVMNQLSKQIAKEILQKSQFAKIVHPESDYAVNHEESEIPSFLTNPRNHPKPTPPPAAPPMTPEQQKIQCDNDEALARALAEQYNNEDFEYQVKHGNTFVQTEIFFEPSEKKAPKPDPSPYPALSPAARHISSTLKQPQPHQDSAPKKRVRRKNCLDDDMLSDFETL